MKKKIASAVLCATLTAFGVTAAGCATSPQEETIIEEYTPTEDDAAAVEELQAKISEARSDGVTYDELVVGTWQLSSVTSEDGEEPETIETDILYIEADGSLTNDIGETGQVEGVWHISYAESGYLVSTSALYHDRVVDLLYDYDAENDQLVLTNYIGDVMKYDRVTVNG